MAPQTPQSFGNHVRLFPIYHYVTLPLLLIYFLYAIYDALFHFSAGALMSVVVAFALLCLALSARMMANTVQDRVIRLEERQRMRALRPPTCTTASTSSRRSSWWRCDSRATRNCRPSPARSSTTGSRIRRRSSRW
jgi:hypothetical protein